MRPAWTPPGAFDELLALYAFGSEAPFLLAALGADVVGVARAFADWHSGLVAPQLAAADTDEFALLNAMQTYAAWDGWRQRFGGDGIQQRRARARATRRPGVAVCALSSTREVERGQHQAAQHNSGA